MKEMQGLVKQLNQVREELATVHQKTTDEQQALSKKEKTIIEGIQRNRQAVMISPSHPHGKNEVLALQPKILKNELVGLILGKIPFNQVALVEITGEDVRDREYITGKKTKFWLRPEILLSPAGNRWYLDIKYLCGGPQSPAKIFFQKGKNGQSYIRGALVKEGD